MAINGHDRNDKANKVVVMKMVKWQNDNGDMITMNSTDYTDYKDADNVHRIGVRMRLES